MTLRQIAFLAALTVALLGLTALTLRASGMPLGVRVIEVDGLITSKPNVRNVLRQEPRPSGRQISTQLQSYEVSMWVQYTFERELSVKLTQSVSAQETELVAALESSDVGDTISLYLRTRDSEEPFLTRDGAIRHTSQAGLVAASLFASATAIALYRPKSRKLSLERDPIKSSVRS